MKFLQDVVLLIVAVVVVIAAINLFISDSDAKLSTPSHVIENVEYFKVLYIQDEISGCWYIAIQNVGITPRYKDDGRQMCD